MSTVEINEIMHFLSILAYQNHICSRSLWCFAGDELAQNHNIPLYIFWITQLNIMTFLGFHVSIYSAPSLEYFLLVYIKSILRGPAYVKTASPTIHQNQWKNDVILDCSFDRLKSRKIAFIHWFLPLTWVTIFTRLGPLNSTNPPPKTL